MTTPARPSILFVDDESQLMKGYFAALQLRSFDVLEATSVDEALALIHDKKQRMDLIVLDVMMPAGVAYADNPDVDEGLNSGSLLYSDVVEARPETPILVITNLYDPDRLRRFPEKCPLLHKLDYPPKRFADEVAKMITAQRQKIIHPEPTNPI